jgi:hypothetical protein
LRRQTLHLPVDAVAFADKADVIVLRALG